MRTAMKGAAMKKGTKDIAQLASLARTALDDPGGLPEGELDLAATVYGIRAAAGSPRLLRLYAIGKLDEIIEILEPAEAREPDEMDTDQALADLRRISGWLAEDVDNDESQGMASDLNAVAAWFASGQFE